MSSAARRSEGYGRTLLTSRLATAVFTALWKLCLLYDHSPSAWASGLPCPLRTISCWFALPSLCSGLASCTLAEIDCSCFHSLSQFYTEVSALDVPP